MKIRFFALTYLALCSIAPPTFGGVYNLIVVEDAGGVSALPYYRTLNLLPSATAPDSVRLRTLSPPRTRRYSEADFLPVHSKRLMPGHVTRRVIAAPGLQPMFLIGDDHLSRLWLSGRLATLQELHAVGLVVQVRSYAALQALRASAPGLLLVPVSGDDVALRLHLHHYPALVTATGIEQ